MRIRSALFALVLAGCADAPTSHQRYITIGSDVVAAAHLDTVQRDGDVSIVALDDDTDLDEIAQIAHEQFHRCGGFVVHDSLADARAALVPDARTLAAIDYTIDHEAAVRAVLPALDANALLGTIRELSGMPTRYYRSESGAAASTWLQTRWQTLAAGRPEITVDLVDHGWPQKSVVMTVPGTTRASEIVVIGGHLDSITMRGKDAPGADDDASGISTITEIIRGLLASGYRPERTIQFMAYAAEEVGLRGSTEIAQNYKKKGVNVVGALQLDMTNYQGSDKDIWFMKDFTNPAQTQFLIALNEKYVGATWGMDACGYACSDHASWHRTGVPASMPFEARSREYNNKIHTKDDTLEMSGNNANHAIKFARLGAAYAIELAKGDIGTTEMSRRDGTDRQGSSDSGSSWPRRLAWLGAGFGALALLLRRRR